jgi:predicted TIM-barrel fold metal-dependent hydrolase
MTTTATETSHRPAAASRQLVIDTDVHVAYSGALSRLPQRWRSHAYSFRGQTEADVIRHRVYSSRLDTFPPGGGAPGSDPVYMAEQLLDDYQIDCAIVNILGAGVEGAVPVAFNEAVAAAANEYLVEDFFERDPRWRGALHVPYERPGRYALRELERWRHEPRFVQVITLFRTERPLGDPKYWDLYEACEELGLPVAVHVGGLSGHTLTGTGWPSFYFEDHAGYPQALPVHMASLVCEGVLDRFPGLKFVIMEGGWTWVPAMAARFDASWRVLRDEVPDLQRAPSEYLRERFWFTTQPIEEPDKSAWLWQIMTSAGLADRVMFSSDYPHWDFDSPKEVIPRSLDPEVRAKVFHGNAEALFGLHPDPGTVQG